MKKKEPAAAAHEEPIGQEQSCLTAKCKVGY